MPVRRYAICDECGQQRIAYSDVNGWQQEIAFEDVFEEDQYIEMERWVVRAFPDEDDPIVIDAEFFCPECAAKDAIYDSGDRAGA